MMINHAGGLHINQGLSYILSYHGISLWSSMPWPKISKSKWLMCPQGHPHQPGPILYPILSWHFPMVLNAMAKNSKFPSLQVNPSNDLHFPWFIFVLKVLLSCFCLAFDSIFPGFPRRSWLHQVHCCSFLDELNKKTELNYFVFPNIFKFAFELFFPIKKNTDL